MIRAFLALILAFTLVSPALASAAMLTVTPASQMVQVGDSVSVDILLDTQGASVDGVDLAYFSYDPSLLSLIDADGNAAGAQITPGSLMGTTAINSADTATGLVSFSQVVAGGTKYTGNGVLAHATFQALAAGTAMLGISFAPGSTTDSNVASGGTDALSAVSGATIVIAAPPSSSPSGGGSSGGGGGGGAAPSGGGGGGAISSGGTSDGSAPSGTGSAAGGSSASSVPTSSGANQSPAQGIMLARTLSRGLSGTDVSTLQGFLAGQGYLSPDNLTGYFGAATEGAVKQYQCAQGIVCDGSPATTGYGVVGARTRAALAGASPAIVPAPPSNQSVAPSTSSGVITKRLAVGMTDAQVLDLQRALNSSSDTRIAASGPGSPGQETEYFGTLTMLALERFQAKYRIASYGTPDTTGYGAVGPLTRTTLNALLAQLPR